MEIDFSTIHVPHRKNLEKIFPRISSRGFSQEKDIFKLPRITLTKVNKLILGSWNRLEYRFLGWEFVDDSGRIRVLFRREKDGLEFWYAYTFSSLIAIYEFRKKICVSN